MKNLTLNALIVVTSMAAASGALAQDAAKAKIPGTKMAFAVIKNEKEINDLWAFISQYDKDGKTK
jgi:hypothetical protein